MPILSTTSFYSEPEIISYDKHFLTYATREFYVQARSIVAQAKKTGLFKSELIYNPNSLPSLRNLISEVYIASKQYNLTRRDCLNAKHGMWAWKPFIVKNFLSTLGENNLLLYSDSGCTINLRNSKRLQLLFDVLGCCNSAHGIFFSLNMALRDTCSSSLISYLGLSNNKIKSIPATCATYFILKASQKTKDLVNTWLHLCKLENYKYLCNGEDTPIHRHDQSILTALLADENHRNNFLILEDESFPLSRSSYSFISATRKKSIKLKLKRALSKIWDYRNSIGY